MISRGVIVSKSLMTNFTATSLSQDANVNVDQFKRMAKSSEQYKPSRD
jgi:hypothetical protein